jgi:hypothetical protein
MANTNPTPTREQVIEAQQLLKLHADGKMKFSQAVLDELDRIETNFVWYSMDHPHDIEAAFAAMEEDRQAGI